jgi:hypothetical protein
MRHLHNARGSIEIIVNVRDVVASLTRSKSIGEA